MTEFFKQLISLITDKTTSWGFKTALFISIIFLIFVSDFYLGFSFNYHLNNKIEQLEKIENLKTKYKNDSISFLELTKIEKLIFKKSHYSENLSRLFLNESIKSETSNIIDQNKPTNKNPITKTNNPIFSLFWMTFSSNYLLYIILPFLIFLPLYNKESRNANGLVGILASSAFILAFIYTTTLIAYQIPLIFKNPIFNYIFNFLIHTAFWTILGIIGNKNKKKNY